MAQRPFDDGLETPLGTDQEGRDRAVRDIPYGRIALAGFGAIAASLAVFAYVTADGLGGEPVAVAPIQTAELPVPVPAPAAASAVAAAPSEDVTATIPDPGKRVATAEQVETMSGVKITRPAGASAPGALIIEVPPALGVHLTPAPDARLVEKDKAGNLPRIGSDGSRAADVYARPVVLPTGLKPDAPRIAIVIGGLGLSRSGTAEAIARLPGPVTLAFAPYGQDLGVQAADARDAGHEILLQAPMEPFDYGSDNPGPRTLLSFDPPAKNVERLRWMMSRFPGYVGIMNFLGGKFTADPDAFAPVLREIAARGLLYADDGTSTRSLAGELARGLPLPIAQADVVLDAVASPEAIDGALARLEALARRQGHAVGSATALPLTIARIERWAQALDRRGIALIPLSAAAAKATEATANQAPDGR